MKRDISRCSFEAFNWSEVIKALFSVARERRRLIESKESGSSEVPRAESAEEAGELISVIRTSINLN